MNPAGFTIHAAIHDGIPDAHCVMHTHTTAGMAVACARDGLSMSNFYSAQLHGKLAYHDFEGITVHADEGPRLVRAIGDRPAVILRNHGLLAWGDTIARTFAILWLLNRACEIQLASTAMGPVIELSEDIQRKCTRDSLQFSARFGAGPGRIRCADADRRPRRPVVSRREVQRSAFTARARSAVSSARGSPLPAATLRRSRAARRREALRKHGWRLQAGDATISAPARVAESPTELGVQDLVVIAVKGPALASVADVDRAVARARDTTVLTAMNGVPWWFFHGLRRRTRGHAAHIHRSGRTDRGGDSGGAGPRLRRPCELHDAGTGSDPQRRGQALDLW